MQRGVEYSCTGPEDGYRLAIASTIESRDPSGAREAMEHHITRGANVMGNLIEGRIKGVVFQH